MIRKLAFYCIPVMILGACGASKKLEVAQGEIDALQSKVQQLEKTNSSLKNELNQMTTQRQVAIQEFTKYKAECDEAQRKLRIAGAILEEQANTMRQVEGKIEEALVDFDQRGVDVYYQNGLVYVSMEDKLLYPSGSAKLSDDGKKALGALTQVLNDYPNLKLIVVGNTDDVQFKKGNTDNWTLSTERANSVVRIMRDDYKVDPARLTAAGRSKYSPVADNATPEGKAKNRRTDIILNPDLKKLWDSIEK
ncbi:MAG: OmpA family protein [Chitinophagaceae bacterium]